MTNRNEKRTRVQVLVPHDELEAFLRERHPDRIPERADLVGASAGEGFEACFTFERIETWTNEEGE